jgi:hypothetical protein
MVLCDKVGLIAYGSPSVCLSQCPGSLYYQAGTCVASCSGGYLIYAAQKICLTSCSEYSRIKLVKVSATHCDTACSVGTQVVDSTGTCVTCTSCVNYCYGWEYEYLGGCVNTCSAVATPMNQFKYKPLRKCVSSCPSVSSTIDTIDSDMCEPRNRPNPCGTACAVGEYSYNGLCAADCSGFPGTFTYEPTKRCVDLCTEISATTFSYQWT